MKKFLFTACVLGACSVLSAGRASAATNGSDDASNAAYNGGWTNGANGNAAVFTAWSFNPAANTSNVGYFLGNSTSLNGTAGANINTGGRAFGMFGNGTGNYANASRNLTSVLSVGQSFSLDLAVNFRNGNKGVDIYNGGTNVAFTFAVAGDNYSVLNTTGTNGSIGNTYSDNTAFHLTFTQTSATSGTWAIDRSGGVTSTSTGTYTGVVSGFHLFEGETNGGAADNLYANNFAVVPEPATWLAGFLTLGAVGLRFAKGRRTLV